MPNGLGAPSAAIELGAFFMRTESELVLKGYAAFLDPPKETAGPAIRALNGHGVTVKVLTGDNDLVARKVCRQVGLDTETMLLGAATAATLIRRLAPEFVIQSRDRFSQLTYAGSKKITRLPPRSS